MFGQRLERILEDKDMQQMELAKFLNVAESTVSQWKKGKRSPDIDTLKKIAKFLGCSSDYLIGLSDEPYTIKEQPKPKDELLDTQIAANMEAQYGEKPSSELVAFIKRVVNEEIENKKNKQ